MTFLNKIQKTILSNKETKVLSLAFIVFIITSIFSAGHHHDDEHFQILEFANYKLGNGDLANLPWEFHERIRPTFQATLVFWGSKTFSLFGINNPFFTAFFFRLLTALLSFGAILLFYKTFKNKIQSESLRWWFLLLSFFTWFIVYDSVRFSSENWSGILFLIGFTMYFTKEKKSLLYLFNIGIIFGFSFLSRYQIGFFVFGFVLWLLIINKEKFKSLVALFLGLLIIIFLGILIDSWFYGEITFSTWRYFEFNLLLGKAASYGTSPWWYYLTTFSLRAIPPLSLFYIFGTFTFCYLYRNSPVTWIILPFLFLHFLIGHKELRFLFPMSLYLPFMLIMTFDYFQIHFQKKLLEKSWVKIFFKIALVLNLCFLTVIMFKSANNQISLYHTVWDRYDKPTNLYYFEFNPYSRVREVQFFKRESLNLRKISSLNEVSHHTDTTNLIILHYKDLDDFKLENEQLIYSSFPIWMKNFNFNNWLTRTESWYIFELSP